MLRSLAPRGPMYFSDSCSWEARTGDTEDSSLDVTETFATAVTLSCLVAEPYRRMPDGWPEGRMDSGIEVWFDADSTVAERDRITYSGTAYRVTEIAPWQNVRKAICERVEPQ